MQSGEEEGRRYLQDRRNTITQSLKDRLDKQRRSKIARREGIAGALLQSMELEESDFFGLAMLNAYARSCDSEPAAQYTSMEAFWEDAEAQSVGASDRSFWDTYEHGRRRRLENSLSAASGFQDALLVNSGMSAFDIALRSLNLGPKHAILCQDKHYFESEEYLNHIAEAGLAKVIRRDISTAEKLEREIRNIGPAVVLVETFLNSPDVVPCPDLESSLKSGAQVILDNSVLGRGALWRAYVDFDNFTVIESGFKYLNQRASSGAIFGNDLTRARACGRRSGVQLQAAALNHFGFFDIDNERRRIKIHGARRAAFKAKMQECSAWSWIRDADDAARMADPAIAAVISEGGGGALIFAGLNVSSQTNASAVRRVVNDWVARMRDEEVEAAVRAGFGWDQTTMRSYGDDDLNRCGAGSFIRISVGLDDREATIRSAQLLNEAAASVVRS